MAFQLSNSLPPCVLYEDEHVLVVNKPAGWNTHAPSPFAGEGIYDWLKHREPRWASLAILHRLDKETSGVMVFGKTPVANRSLTEQFATRAVRKKYLLLTDREPQQREFTAKSKIARVGERYVSGTHGELAETRFKLISVGDDGRSLRSPSRGGGGNAGEMLEPPYVGPYKCVEAAPLTGRTHQIRVHAAEQGFPILGDALYGGTAWVRVCLHAAELAFKHPATGEPVSFRVAPDFEADPRRALRAALIAPEATTTFRLIHGASDGWPGWYVERLGEFVCTHSERPPTGEQQAWLAIIGAPSTASARTVASPRAEPVLGAPIRGVYHKVLSRQVRRTTAAEASPQPVAGEDAPGPFTIRENGVKFELSFSEGYSVGLFLDQRDNRRRLLTGHIAADFGLKTSDSRLEVLNCFAYTCGFSVCAALAGARTTSLDLSKKYLDWGRRNFALNGLDPAEHNFIFGDTFDWLKRLAKKQQAFDVIVLDPPTFSQSKEGGVFRAEKDYGRLVSAALPGLRPGGVLLASTNAAEWKPEDFLADVQQAIRAARRHIAQQHYVPQPPDFPVSRDEPAYLKTVWLRVA